VSQVSASPPADNNTKPTDPPGLVESLNQVNQAGQQTLHSATHAFDALRTLLWADLALARGALRQALLWSVLVVVFATSAWLFLIVALTVLMQWLGLPWAVALLMSGLISLLAAFFALSNVRFYLRHTDLAATRRQLAKLRWPEHSTSDTNAETDTENTAHSRQTP